MWAFVRLFAEGMTQRGEWRVLHLALAFVTLAAMVRTGTRGTLVQLVVVLPLLVATSPVRASLGGMAFRFLFAVPAILAIGVLAWLSLAPDKKLTYMGLFRVDPVDGVLDSRGDLWAEAMEKARERPWLGRGLGSSSFLWLTDEEYREISSLATPDRVTIHSQYLEVFYEFGALGFLVFAWLCFALVWGASRWFLYQGPQAWVWRMFAVYAVNGMLGGLFHGGQFSTGQVGLICWWLIYCCVLTTPLALAPTLKRPVWSAEHGMRSEAPRTPPTHPYATAPRGRRPAPPQHAPGASPPSA